MAPGGSGSAERRQGYCLADRISAPAQEVGYRNSPADHDEIDGAFREIEARADTY
jgi:hypothetical protein